MSAIGNEVAVEGALPDRFSSNLFMSWKGYERYVEFDPFSTRYGSSEHQKRLACHVSECLVSGWNLWGIRERILDY